MNLLIKLTASKAKNKLQKFKLKMEILLKMNLLTLFQINSFKII